VLHQSLSLLPPHETKVSSPISARAPMLVRLSRCRRDLHDGGADDGVGVPFRWDLSWSCLQLERLLVREITGYGRTEKRHSYRSQ
jgi:hypothetical protein